MAVFDGDRSPFSELADEPRGAGPAHTWIEGWIERHVADGTLTPGDRLPAEEDLARLFAVSRMTLRQALGALEDKMLIVRRRGRFGGTFIREPRIEHDLNQLPSFTQQMHRAVVRPGGVVVSAELVSAAAVPAVVRIGLALSPRARAYRIVKVRLANDEPVGLEDTWLPASIFRGLLSHDLTGSLYSLMGRTYAAGPAVAHEELEPALADEAVARHLGIEVGALLMKITRTTETADGRRVEFARDLFRADRARMTMTSRADDAWSHGRLRADAVVPEV